jgi:hypothetical protein
MILLLLGAGGLLLTGCSCMDFGYCPELFPKPN